MRNCSVCVNQVRLKVESDLAAGKTVREVALEYGLSKSSVARHRVNCLAPRLAAAARIVTPAPVIRSEITRAKAIAAGRVEAAQTDIASLAGLVQRIGKSIDRLEDAASTAMSDGSFSSLAMLSSQLHRGIEVIAKLQGLGAEQAADGPRFSIHFSLPGATPGQVEK